MPTPPQPADSSARAATQAPRSNLSPVTVFQRDRLAMLARWAAESAETGIGSFRFLRRNVILVNNAEMAGEVLLTRDEDFHKGPALSLYSRPLLGNGLLTSEEGFHRRQRRLSAPAFAHRRVASYADVMATAADRAQARWENGGVVDIGREMMRLTLGIVGKTLFDAENIEEDADSIGQSLTLLLNYFTNVVRSPLRLPTATIPFWRPDVRKALRDLDEMIFSLIRDRRASGRDAGDLLSMLLLSRDENGEAMDDRQIRDEAMTIFLAGHETTANALTWSWYLLSRHPEAAARVQAETRGVLQGRIPTYADLASMPFTLQVFKEAVRLYPPAYVIARQAQRRTAIGGYQIPDRAVVLVSPWLLHRKPQYFPNPEEFQPDRWGDPTFEKALPRHAYLPFGGGPRICIGASFAMMEGHLILAAIAQNVLLEQIDNAPPRTDPLIVLRPKGTIALRVGRTGVTKSD